MLPEGCRHPCQVLSRAGEAAQASSAAGCWGTCARPAPLQQRALDSCGELHTGVEHGWRALPRGADCAGALGRAPERDMGGATSHLRWRDVIAAASKSSALPRRPPARLCAPSAVGGCVARCHTSRDATGCHQHPRQVQQRQRQQRRRQRQQQRRAHCSPPDQPLPQQA